MMYVKAFGLGGLICMAAQVVLDNTKLTAAHVLVGLTVLGGILGGLGLYDPLVHWAGAGASVPISSFGNALVKGVLPALEKDGVLGALTGMFQITSTGIAAAIVFAWIVAVIFDPKS
jgi:stage V sporulation protein AE